MGARPSYRATQEEPTSGCEPLTPSLRDSRSVCGWSRSGALAPYGRPISAILPRRGLRRLADGVSPSRCHARVRGSERRTAAARGDTKVSAQKMDLRTGKTRTGDRPCYVPVVWTRDPGSWRLHDVARRASATRALGRPKYFTADYLEWRELRSWLPTKRSSNAATIASRQRRPVLPGGVDR